MMSSHTTSLSQNYNSMFLALAQFSRFAYVAVPILKVCTISKNIERFSVLLPAIILLAREYSSSTNATCPLNIVPDPGLSMIYLKTVNDEGSEIWMDSASHDN